MKQVFLKGKKVVVEDVPEPVCGDSEVLVANAYSAISVGTELSIIERSSLSGVLKDQTLIKKALEYAKEKGIRQTVGVAKEFRESLGHLGYSTAGTIIAVGRNIADLKVGDTVACAGENANHAEVVAVSRNLVAKIPEGVSFEEAAFTTLAAISMHGIRRAERQFGETIVILGVGLLGQLAVQIAKAAGYRIIAIDKDPERVDLAKRTGADVGLVVGKHDVEKDVGYHTDGIGADAVIIYAATPSSKLVNQAARMARKKGRVVVVGDVGLAIDRALFYEKELDLLISRSYGPGRYDQLYEKKGIDYPIEYIRWTENRNMLAFLELLNKKKIDMKPLLDAVAIFPIEEAEKAYELLTTSEKKPLGVLLKYDTSKYFAPTGEVTLHKMAFEISPRAVEGKINVAVIGAGNFARNILLPLLSKIPGYNLKAIAEASGPKAKQVASKFKVEYCTTDYKEILKDGDVDLVIITTPHNLHYLMIIDAAKAGKAIYVEKPMCLNERELKDIVKVISETKVPLIVGFNRRYAPLAVKAKELLKQKGGPYLINYRVNAEFVPKTHWIQDPEVGGGRVIGECCHFFDLFNYFIGSDVKSISTESIPVDSATVMAQDNIVATLTWADGSLTTLTYTALGHQDLPKERIEIFVGGNSIVIDDFAEMKLYGFKERGIRLKKQDKGHFQELIEFAKFLKGEKSNVISFEESVKAMEITFEVEKSLRSMIATKKTK